MHVYRGLAATLLAGSLALLTGCPVPPLVVLPAELPNGVELRSYTAQLSVEDGNALRWAVSAGTLPAGITLDDESGQLRGVPTQDGTFAFSIQASDLNLVPRIGERSYTLEIIPRLTVDSSIESAQVGVAYSQAIDTTGGVMPYTFALVGLPAGLSFDTATGTISGTPVVADPSITLQVTVTDSGDPQQTRIANLELVVRPQPLMFITDSLPDAEVGTAYSATIETEDGRAPVTFAVSDGLIPAGLRLDTDTGEISGTPTTAGTATFTIEAEDSDDPANTITREFTLNVTE